MKLSRRVRYLILGFMLFLNMALIWPNSNHERGVDGFLSHVLAESISEHGYAKWVLHPLSFFNLYPMSAESGIPYLLSSFSQMSGVNLEFTILFFSILFKLICLIGIYLFLRLVVKNEMFIFLGLFAYIISPMVIHFTSWTIIVRQPFISLIPIMLIILFSERVTRFKKIFIIAGLVFTAFAFSRMSLLLVPLFLAYFVSSFIYSSKRNILETKVLANRGLRAFLYLGIVIILFSLAVFGFSFYAPHPFTKTLLFEGENIIYIFLNIIVRYVSGFGLLFLIIPFAILNFLIIKKLTKFQFMMMFFTILYSYIILDSLYVMQFMIVFLALLIPVGFEFISRYIKNNGHFVPLAFSIATLAILFTLLYPLAREEITGETIETNFSTNDDTYDCGVYLGYYLEEDESYICNDVKVSRATQAYSNRNPGDIDGTNYLIYDRKDGNELISTKVKDFGLEDFVRRKGINAEIDDWKYSGEYSTKRHYWQLTTKEPNDKNWQVLHEEKFRTVVLSERSDFVYKFGKESLFFNWAEDSLYLTYANGNIRAYHLA